jgi:ABC-type amino acid transport system permease subunit
MLIAFEVVAAFALLLGIAFAGWRIQKALPVHHRNRETIDAVRLVLTMLVTLSAVVLGLLTSSAKGRYDDQRTALERYSVDLIELDQRLRQYGPDTSEMRGTLRSYTAAAIADTWPDEPQPSGRYPTYQRPTQTESIESITLGEMLSRLDQRIEQMAPDDEFHRRLAERLRIRSADVLQQRWRLLSSAHPTLSWPLLVVLMLWLLIIFVMFGLSAPHNALVYTVLGLWALSMASSLYLILEFDTPQSGLIRVPSEPMREALSHMDLP